MAEAVSAVAMTKSAREAKQVRTVVWVMSLALVGLLFRRLRPRRLWRLRVDIPARPDTARRRDPGDRRPGGQLRAFRRPCRRRLRLCPRPIARDHALRWTVTEPIKMWMSAHALAIVQSLILISAANGAPVFVRAAAGSALCSSDRRGGRVARRSSSTRSLQDLARARRSYSSCGLRRSPHEFAMAAGCARCRFRHGGRLPLVLRQTAFRARAEQHDARSRSGS